MSFPPSALRVLDILGGLLDDGDPGHDVGWPLPSTTTLERCLMSSW